MGTDTPFDRWLTTEPDFPDADDEYVIPMPGDYFSRHPGRKHTWTYHCPLPGERHTLNVTVTEQFGGFTVKAFIGTDRILYARVDIGLDLEGAMHAALKGAAYAYSVKRPDAPMPEIMDVLNDLG